MRHTLWLCFWTIALSTGALPMQTKQAASFRKIGERDIKECQNAHEDNCWRNDAVNVTPRPPLNGYARFEIAKQATRFLATIEAAEPGCANAKDVTVYIQVGSERVYSATFGAAKEIDLDVTRLPDDDQGQAALDVTKPPPAQFRGEPVSPGTNLTVAASGPTCAVHYRNARFLVSPR